NKPDVVFLDVRMPVMDGFGVIESVGPESMPVTVMVTAYDTFAIRAFEANAIDYLLKPFDEERVQTTLNRVKKYVNLGRQTDINSRLESILKVGRPKHLDRIPVRTSGRIVFLEIGDIRWIESSANYLKFCTREEVFVTRGTMSALEETLDPDRFLRIHRSTIINVEHLKELRPWYTGEYVVIMNGGKELTLARRYRYQLQRLLNRSATLTE
ncbi:MAG TPA: LytTR family DNA-binding domain-containing protein, partial [Gemmatimonadaceae bacterium]|nr:LytTR family DNA-binding domain-containing protein [Gemmatimonadaceae bacterium]